jgi:hypothetical protein
MEFPTVGGKAVDRFRIGQIDQPSGGIAGEEHPRLLEGLADGRQEKAEGYRFGEIRFLEEAPCFHHGESSGAGGKSLILIGVIQAAAGEDISPAHKGLIRVAPHEKYFIRPSGPVTQQDDGRRIPRHLDCPTFPFVFGEKALHCGVSHPPLSTGEVGLFGD